MKAISRISYKIIIQLLWLVALISIAEAIIFFIIGQTQFILLDSYKFYFLMHLVPAIFLSVLLLKYYWYNKFLVTFWTALLLLTISLIHFESTFIVISTLHTPPSYLPTLIANLFAQALYSLSLIIKPTGTRRWLRIAGYYQIVTIIPVAFCLYRTLWLPSPETNATIVNLQPWFSLLLVLSPLLFIPNFIDETRQIKKGQTFSDWQVVSVLIILMVCGMTLKLGMDAFWSMHWSKRNREDTIKLSKSLEPHMFIGSRGDTLYYGLVKPLNYDSTKKYPLIINLSQGAQPGKSISKSQDMGGAAVAGLFLTKPYREKYPSYIFVPSCPVGSSWGGMPNLKTSDELLYEAIKAINKREPGIDSNRHYVTGISFAGYGTWNVIGKRPDLFAAAIPLCGGGDPLMASKMVNVAIWAFHGEKDINVPVTYTRNMIQAIKKAGGHPKYTEFAGQGHNIWDLTLKTEGVWDWLFAQRQK
jgi:poly(3-hydroxybutyrate) depolymerase